MKTDKDFSQYLLNMEKYTLTGIYWTPAKVTGWS